KNISFWGEDRHFCIRAQALGFDLFVDTNYPAFHIYREDDLQVLENAKNKKESTDVNIIMEVVKNGIESLGTSHYQNGYETDWKPFFSKEMVSDLSNHIQDELVEAHQKQLIVNADVYDIKLVELRE